LATVTSRKTNIAAVKIRAGSITISK